MIKEIPMKDEPSKSGTGGGSSKTGTECCLGHWPAHVHLELPKYRSWLTAHVEMGEAPGVCVVCERLEKEPRQSARV